MTKSLPEILKNQPVVVDGAMATELEKHDIDTDNDLWSAMALIEQPEAIYDVHKSYFDAGAQVAITNTYQANIDAFVKAGVPADDAQKMITTVRICSYSPTAVLTCLLSKPSHNSRKLNL